MKHIFLSNRADLKLKEFLTSLGKIVIEIKDSGQVYKEISDHPDIYVCLIGEHLIVARDQLENIADQLGAGFESLNIIPGSKPVGEIYPASAIYNGLQVGSFFIHNTSYTDDSIIQAVKKSDLKIIDIKQGYANCNIVAVDNASIITSDEGILRTIRENYPQIDVLKVSPGHVMLDGFEYGFLGGTSGRIGDYVIFNGNLEEHPDFSRIRDFIESRSLKLKYFREYPLTDIGSIIGS